MVSRGAFISMCLPKADVLKVISAAFEAGNNCDAMDLVCDFDYVRNNGGIHIDAVYDGGKMIGASSGRMLSAKTKEMLSVCTIDQDYAVEVKEAGHVNFCSKK